MKATFEKLATPPGHSFRCFDRSTLLMAAKWHRHPEIELTYVPRGEGSRLVGDHISTYKDHDLVLVGSNLPHNWTSDEYRGQKFDCHTALVAQFHPNFLGRDFFEQAEMRPIGDLFRRSQRGLWYTPDIAQEIGSKLLEIIQTTGPRRLLLLLDCLEILSRIADPMELATTGYIGPTSSASESRMQVVFDFMQRHFTDPDMNTGNLAAELQMNASAFCRFFKQSTGMTPSAYINELRIGYACRRLLDSEKSVLDVCYESGFASISHFNEIFRKLRHMSPRQFRTQHAKLQASDFSSPS